jgi:hypothetical protein
MAASRQNIELESKCRTSNPGAGPVAFKDVIGKTVWLETFRVLWQEPSDRTGNKTLKLDPHLIIGSEDSTSSNFELQTEHKILNQPGKIGNNSVVGQETNRT